jgi:uncharacterized membrane protein
MSWLRSSPSLDLVPVPTEPRRRLRAEAVAIGDHGHRGTIVNEKGFPMADQPVFVFLAAYDDAQDARLDYDAVFELHAAGVIGTFDAAVVEKDARGKVRIHKTEKPTQHGAWTGIAVGAIAGILFPPSIIAGAVVGGAGGGVIGHLWRGMSRGDLKDLGEMLDEGQATLIVVGRSKLGQQLEKAAGRARRTSEKELDADAKQLDAELDSAAAELAHA